MILRVCFLKEVFGVIEGGRESVCRGNLLIHLFINSFNYLGSSSNPKPSDISLLDVYIPIYFPFLSSTMAVAILHSISCMPLEASK